jgi:hypothetical protein
MFIVFAVAAGFSICPANEKTITVPTVIVGVSLTMGVAVIFDNVVSVPVPSATLLINIVPVEKMFVGLAVAAWIPNATATLLEAIEYAPLHTKLYVSVPLAGKVQLRNVCKLVLLAVMKLELNLTVFWDARNPAVLIDASVVPLC